MKLRHLLRISFRLVQRLKLGHGVLLCVLLLSGYIALVHGTVFAAAERKQTEELIIDLESEVAGLEAKFFSLTEKLTLDRAVGLGLEEAGNRASFVIRKNLTLGLLPPGAGNEF
jgi:hypothetical protein